MKKILLTFFLMLTLALSVQAKATKKDFSSIINESKVDKNSISISIKNTNSKKTLYALNDRTLMNPASVQKLLTTPVIYETLGSDYSFTTSLYKRGENCYLIKLGADPYLKSDDLKSFVKLMDPNTQRIFIDDNALDTKYWGEGWQWDDDMNILMPKFSSYNLDKNLIKLTIIPPEDQEFATILNPSKYPLVFFNHITYGETTSLKVDRDNSISNNTLILSGTVSHPTVVYIPSNDLQKYFKFRLKKLLEARNMYIRHAFIPNKLQENDILVQEIKHNIDLGVDDILKNSNNLVSETLFKLAGAKHLNIETGSDSAGIKMFNDYCEKNNLDNSRVRITDASGVSKNNLVSTDFITSFLNLNKDNPLMDKLPSPGEGTLAERMIPLKDNLKAKTGTLSDLSSIAGYLTTKSGKKISFCIIINDIKLSDSDKKMLEDFILREAYLRL